MKRWPYVVLIGIVLSLPATAGIIWAFGTEKDSFYRKSLHYTGEGMRYWYEEKDGFKTVTDIPYEKLSCKSCHNLTCDNCHAEKKGEKWAFTVTKAKKMETCLPCHSRQSFTIKVDKEAGTPDVHFAKGQVCSDCHGPEDMHGDGSTPSSMREAGAVRASCKTCHHETSEKAPIFDATTRSHRVHKGKLDCLSCHVTNTMACYNCHFSKFLETGKRAGNFIPMKSWTLLVNYQGKVTSGIAQTLVFKDKKFIAYAPYFTHSVTAKGRGCGDCHNNEAMKRIKAGEKVPVVAFVDGKVEAWKGMVPLAPDKLSWVFLDKKEGKWVPLESDAEVVIQFVAYGEPLTEKQLKKLRMPLK
jgi:hypothetical protein